MVPDLVTLPTILLICSLPYFEGKTKTIKASKIRFKNCPLHHVCHVYLHIHRIAATKAPNYMPREPTSTIKSYLSLWIHTISFKKTTVIITYLCGGGGRGNKNKYQKLTSDIKVASFGNRAL
jgi:hypothetical protein